MNNNTKLDNEVFEKYTEEDRANEIDYDDYTVDELQTMIAYGDIKKQDVDDFYNNEWWANDEDNDGWLARTTMLSA